MRKMKRILYSVLSIAALAVLVGGATFAYFSDTETSNGNTFTAGTLDLLVDGSNNNVVKFNVTNMRPGNQPKASYLLHNNGTLKGYLDLENISVTNNENSCVEPEVEAGDTTCGTVGDGELQDVVNLRLFIDYGGDGWISTGDKVFYNGKVKNLPSHFELDESMNAGTDLHIVALFDWWSTPNDDLAQGDTFSLDMTFELAQTAAQ